MITERLKEKDGIIKSALQEKRSILAELYKIPPEEFTTITDVSNVVRSIPKSRQSGCTRRVSFN